MNATTQATPETVNARLTLDVTYLLNGEAASELLARLERMCELAIGEGLLSGDTAAEVDTWSIDVSEVPSAADHETLEAEIAAFMQQRIEDGNLSAEDIPVRLARYGLMAPEAFADEMRERMGMDDDAPTGRAVIPSTEPADGSEIEMQIAVACVDASGGPDMPVFKVRITQEEYDLGIHYDKAKDFGRRSPVRRAVRLLRRCRIWPHPVGRPRTGPCPAGRRGRYDRRPDPLHPLRQRRDQGHLLRHQRHRRVFGGGGEPAAR